MFMNKIKIIFNICLFFCFIVVPGVTVAAKAQPVTIHFITLSDIHFNPFYSCQLKQQSCVIIDKLRHASVVQWPEILAKANEKLSCYGEDTNYALFNSSLAALKKQAEENQVAFVLVLGDLLSHQFTENYQHYTGDKSQQGIQSFVDKTMQFISLALQKTFADRNVYMTVGNNDSYGAHYTSNPLFYKNIAPIWASLIKESATRHDMVSGFARAGYYALTLPQQKNVDLIVLNTTYFSIYGKGMQAEADRELIWLAGELARLKKQQHKALLLLHIPFIVAQTKPSEKTVPKLGLWQDAYQQRFLKLLANYSTQVMVILPGHLHMDWFQLINLAKGQAILVSATPAISPIIGNNPGFKVYQYDPHTLSLQDYANYYLDLNGVSHQWQLEYDFKQRYAVSCSHCGLSTSIKRLQNPACLDGFYKNYFAVGRNPDELSQLTQQLASYWKANVWGTR
jgi:sphingomyelin phosphodiesterase acid-like 3